MFRKWLSENKIENFDFSGKLFEPASNREFWDEKYNHIYISEAEKYLGFEWPIIRATDYMQYNLKGVRWAQEKPSSQRRRALVCLFLGELLENKKRFIPDIIDGLFLICEESFWGVAAHFEPGKENELLPDVQNPYIDLFAAETASILSTVLYMLRDQLSEACPEIVTRIEYELNRRILKPYLSHKDFPWMGYHGRGVNNWNPWIISNILTVVLLSESGKAVINEAIPKLLFEINNIYTSLPFDGGCEEGASYWCLSGGRIFEFCEQLYIATNGKINFFDDQKIKNIGEYEGKAYVGGEMFVNFADGGPFVLGRLLFLGYGFGKRIGSEKLASLSKAYITEKQAKGEVSALVLGRHLKQMLFFIINEKEIRNLPQFTDENDYFLPEVENAFIRNNEWFCAIKGGNNEESHNHNDIGSFALYYQNKPVLIDTGCEAYTKKTFSSQRYEIWTMCSDWHNLPVVNGCTQPFGKKYRSDYFTHEGKCVRVGLASAYDSEAHLSSFDRKTDLTSQGLIVCDSFSFTKQNNTVSHHFITHHDVEIRGNEAIIDGKFVLSCDTPSQILLESQDFIPNGILSKNWNKERANRIVFSFQMPDTAQVTFTLKREEN